VPSSPNASRAPSSRARDVDPAPRLPVSLCCSATTFSMSCPRAFPLRSVTSRSQKAEWQHTLRVHRATPRARLVLDPASRMLRRLRSRARAPACSRRANASRPRACRARAERTSQVSGTARRPQIRFFHRRLPGRHAVCVTEKQDVAQLDRPPAVVLRELVLVELRETQRRVPSSPWRRAARAVLPVNGDELAQFIGALEDTLERLGHQTAMGSCDGHSRARSSGRVTSFIRARASTGERGERARARPWAPVPRCVQRSQRRPRRTGSPRARQAQHRRAACARSTDPRRRHLVSAPSASKIQKFRRAMMHLGRSSFGREQTSRGKQRQPHWQFKLPADVHESQTLRASEVAVASPPRKSSFCVATSASAVSEAARANPIIRTGTPLLRAL